MSGPPASLAPHHLERSSTVDRVAEELRRAVFDGELESGTALREVALAGSLGVSRPTVREALTCSSPRGWPTARAEPRRQRRPARGRLACATCAAPAGAGGGGVRGWHAATPPARRRPRRAARTTPTRSGRRRPTRSSTSGTWPSTSPGRLTGSPAWCDGRGPDHRAPAGPGPGRPDPPQRPRPGRHHAALVGLLEAGRIEGADGAGAFLRAHLRDAEVAIIGALGLDPS